MKDYLDGWLIYNVRQNAAVAEVCDLIRALSWDDGYIAFSKGELRWQGKPLNDTQDLIILFNHPHKDKDIEGYVMEAGLWRQDGELIYEELSIERDAGGFFTQHWQLHTSKDTIGDKKYLPCYYRYAQKVLPLRQSKIFKKGEIRAVEIIVPDYRLHIYMTTKGG